MQHSDVWRYLRTVVLISVVLDSCSCAINHRAPILNNDDNEPLRVCRTKQHLTYWIDRNPIVSDESLESVIRAAQYWNGLTAPDVFLLADSASADVLVYIDGNRPYGADGMAIGHASVYAPDGCTILATVWLSALETGNMEFFETIIRHELGHVLGLGHRSGSFCPDLMCNKIEPVWSTMHPMDADGEHLNALRTLYPERTWAKGAGRWELR